MSIEHALCFMTCTVNTLSSEYCDILAYLHPAHSSTDAQQTTPMMACAGQNISQIDSLFVGDILGKKSDIADGSLRDWEFRKFNNLVGDYWVAPSFLDAMGVRIPQPS